MSFKFLLSFCLIIDGSLGTIKLTIHNNCRFTVWPGIQGDSGQSQLEYGGFELGENQSQVIKTPDDWAGRIWGRTKCDPKSGRSETGDCDRKIKCNGSRGVQPVSLIKLKLRGFHELDHYNISLVDGFNLPIEMLPISGFSTRNDNDKYDCKSTGWHEDLNFHCPLEFAIIIKGQIVACKSQYWILNNHPAIFKNNTFTCRGSSNTHYKIIFCP